MKTLAEAEEEQPNMTTTTEVNDNNENQFPPEITDNILSRLPVKSMITLKVEEEEQQQQLSNSSSTMNKKKKTSLVSFPAEITDDILSRLPVKSVLRSKSVCKPWLSLITNPSFTKLHFTRSTITGLFISARDKLAGKHYLLSASCDGGQVTHLMTLDSYDITKAEHVNGLVCFTSKVSFSAKIQAFLLNPSTRKLFKIPDPVSTTSEYGHLGYLFGFDESRDEHKVLLMRTDLNSKTREFMIFSLSSNSWRKIDVGEPPVGFSWDRLSCDLDGGVCVNSVVHVMLQDMSFDILPFDFVTEKFSFISVPRGVVPHEFLSYYARNGYPCMKQNAPFIIKINDGIGVVCHEHVTETNEIHIWLLQDYEDRVWVRETIKIPESWNELGGLFPLPVDVNMDEIMFSSSKSSENVLIVPVYNWKSRCFKLLHFTLNDQFLCSETVMFNHVKCYVESILPL